MFNPDSRTIATGSDDNNIHLSHVYTGKYQKTFIGHKGRVNTITFIRVGKYLPVATTRCYYGDCTNTDRMAP